MSDEALELLRQIWHQPLDPMEPDLGYRPVICLSFGDNEGIARVRRADFEFFPANITTTIAVINAQEIAVQVKITSSADATLDYLLAISRITPFDTGNGGNAAIYSTILAFLSVLREEIYGDRISNPRTKPGEKGLSVSA
jgi:hypothetical protein